MDLIAQMSSGYLNPLSALVLALCAGATGILIGYALGYRFKRRYLAAARQLASLRGENFRGELKTIMPTAVAHGRASDKTDEVKQALREKTETIKQQEQLLAELRSQLQDTRRQLQDQAAQLAEASSTATNHPPPGEHDSYQWQIEQLHKEQIEMQIKLDESLATIAELRDQLRSRDTR